MNKYDILEGKLTAINAYIDTMCLESNATMEYLKQYKEYVNELIIAIQNRTIRNSNGAVMGVSIILIMSAHKDNHHKNFGPLNLSEWLLPKLIKSMEISLKNLGRNLHLGALKDIRNKNGILLLQRLRTYCFHSI